MLITLAIALGFVLDWIFGDPDGAWHPICAIGALISRTERLLRRIFPATPRGEKAAGVVLWLVVCGVSYAVPLGLIFAFGRANPWLAFVAQILFCYQILARKCLADAGERVRTALERSLGEGRQAVAMYVSRDTSALDEEGVIKATVETIAENTTDGVIAPLCFMLLGGAPLAFLYKAVNTLDSMVGYRNDRYEHFGWFSAKVDDWFNFIPARIAAACMMAGAGMLRFDSHNARRIFRRDRFKHKSPNSAQTESVCAGALHIQLGGSAEYSGQMLHKPTIGDNDRMVVKSDITRAADLMTAAAVFALLLGLTMRLAITFTPVCFS